MEFNVYFNKENQWVKKTITSPKNASEDFFRVLKIRVQQELNEIRRILQLLKKGDSHSPIAIKDENQKYVDLLVKMRKFNQIALDQLKCILLKDEFIICEHCGGLMSKKPINISYKKIGDNIILTDNNRYTKIDYIYSCPNCVFFVAESDYLSELKFKKMREDLIAKGEIFVPNKLGTFYRIK